MTDSLIVKFVPEIEIDEGTSDTIVGLLSQCFPGEGHDGRDYFKQLPHHRILAYEDDRLVGHLGVDLRVMNLNGQAIRVFGAIDVCVAPDRQGLGIGTDLLQRFETVARHSNRVDFLFLLSKNPAIYEKLGYRRTKVQTTWLKIDQHKNYGLGIEQISDALLLYKAISDTQCQWNDGELDLLGYMY